MLRAKDIMTREVISVRRELPINQALDLVVNNGISGLPVVDDEMNLIAILSEKDLLQLFNKSEETETGTVNDFMTQPAVYFEENENLLDVCNFLMKNIFRRVPVTSNNKLVGIISIRDILKHVREIIGLSREKVEQL